MHMHPYMRAYVTLQKILCHENYCELILSLARASCRLSFPPALIDWCCFYYFVRNRLVALLEALCARIFLLSRGPKPVARRCSLKKSVQIHASLWRSRRCGVAQASFDHLRWCRPHPVGLWFALALGRGPHPPQSSIFTMFFAGFSIHKNSLASWRVLALGVKPRTSCSEST